MTHQHVPWLRRHGFTAPLIVVIVAGLVIIAALATYIAYEVTRPELVTVAGTVTITDNIDGDSICQGKDGFDDIREGTIVVIHDPANKVIATGSLRRGKGESDFPTTCQFAFTVPDVPRQKFYGIEVSHRGVVTFTAAQVADGKVALSMGS